MSGFDGLRVLALESRRATELSKLISTYGGRPVVAPAMREVPLQSNTEALAFATKLFAGEFDMIIFLTGVGARALLAVVETAYKREEYVEALQRLKVVARGPKPVVALGPGTQHMARASAGARRCGEFNKRDPFERCPSRSAGIRRL